MNTLPVGKLPTEALQKFIDKIETKDKQLLLGPSVGEDAAVIKLKNRLLVVTTDPVTFAPTILAGTQSMSMQMISRLWV